MDERVLTNIKRDNISLEAYKGINAVLAAQDRSQEAEVIVPLPGETLQTYLKGIEDLVNSGVRKVTSYTLQLLYGTDYKDEAYKRANGYLGKWRVVPLDFGNYEGRIILDAEEVAVSSNTLSFPEYLQIRSLAFVTELVYNNSPFQEVQKYLSESGVSAFNWIKNIWERMSEAPDPIVTLHARFLRQTIEELWDSEQALLQHYQKPEHYDQLVRGEAGGNVLFKHKSLVLTQHLTTWIEFILDVAKRILREGTDYAPIESELSALSLYMQNKLEGVLNPAGNTEDLWVGIPYDILGWMKDQNGRRFGAFHSSKALLYRFYFDPRQLAERQDTFQRYGSDVSGLARILAKTPTLHRLFRHVESISDSECHDTCQNDASLSSPRHS